MKMINTIFIGSGEFAVPILEKIETLEYINLKAVITQPDRPVGRKQILTPTPVGQQSIGVDILKPEKLSKVAHEILEKYKPELIIVASYGQMIPNEILEFPKYNCLNFHGSLLPKLRGAVPVQMAILNGLEETGVTLQVMSQGMDEGDIISQLTYKITHDETSESLMKSLAELSVKILESDLPKWIDGVIQAQKQDEGSAIYCFKSDLTKEKAEITFQTDINLAERMVRAFTPWPIAWIKLADSGKILKIYQAKILNYNINSGEKIQLVREDKDLLLLLKNGVLKLEVLQLEGKKKSFTSDYLFLAN